MKAEEFPDRNFAEKCWTHDLARLVALAALKDQRDADTRADADLSANWGVVKDWNESSRYARKSKGAARALLGAITNARHGVLPWIRKRW